jgi:hypothetical protein
MSSKTSDDADSATVGNWCGAKHVRLAPSTVLQCTVTGEAVPRVKYGCKMCCSVKTDPWRIRVSGVCTVPVSALDSRDGERVALRSLGRLEAERLVRFVLVRFSIHVTVH